MNTPLYDLNYGEDEEAAVLEVLRSRWISSGPKVVEFEAEFAARHHALYGVAVTNCTAALHLGLILLGVGPGDEVILPSLTFVATANVVRMVGAQPVFADLESRDEWLISPSDIQRKITPKTKVIIAMHYAGYLCDMNAICGVAKAHGIAVIEDACHAPLGQRDGQAPGLQGDIACYSFYSNKNLATGEGGMLITNNEVWADRARVIRSHGLTTSAYERHQGGAFYDVVEMGYNYRMDDIRAALGIVQLHKLEEDIEKRNELVQRYRHNLAGLVGVQVPFLKYQGRSSHYIFTVLLDGGIRTQVRERLKAEGIETSMHYLPVHRFSQYRGDPGDELPLTEEIGDGVVTLPLYGAMSYGQVDYVCDHLINVFRSEG